MLSVAIDTNVLVYAEINSDPEKHRRAVALLKRSISGVIPAQALGELVRAAQRKAPALLASVVGAIEAYKAVFRTPPTTNAAIAVAAELALERKLQFWDALICVVAAQAGATILLTEDMQDGADIRGLRIVNPFDAGNDALMDRLLLL